VQPDSTDRRSRTPAALIGASDATGDWNCDRHAFRAARFSAASITAVLIRKHQVLEICYRAPEDNERDDIGGYCMD